MLLFYFFPSHYFNSGKTVKETFRMDANHPAMMSVVEIEKKIANSVGENFVEAGD